MRRRKGIIHELELDCIEVTISAIWRIRTGSDFDNGIGPTGGLIYQAR